MTNLPSGGFICKLEKDYQAKKEKDSPNGGPSRWGGESILSTNVGNILLEIPERINWFSAAGSCVCQGESGFRIWSVPVVKIVEVQANSVEEALAIANRKAEHIGATLMYQTPEAYMDYLKN